MNADHTLQHDVMAELEWEPRVDAAHLGVTADAGVVTLSGHVSSLTQKQTALAAARRVRGVRVIADEIEVRLPGDRKWHDDEIGKRAGDILSWSLPDVAERIRIRVAHGVVTLEGVVDRYVDRIDAEQQIRRLSGVVGVENKLMVTTRINPAGVKESIETAFQRSADLEARNITVTAEGPLVTLQGRVRSWYEHELAERAAWAAPGVTEVRNLILVTG